MTDDRRPRWSCQCGSTGLASVGEYPPVSVESAIYYGWLVHRNTCSDVSTGLDVEIIGSYERYADPDDDGQGDTL